MIRFDKVYNNLRLSAAVIRSFVFCPSFQWGSRMNCRFCGMERWLLCWLPDYLKIALIILIGIRDLNVRIY